MGGLLLVPHHIVTEYGIELWVIFDNPILETEKFFISTQLLPYSLFRLRILLRLVGLNDSPEIVDNCYYIFNKMRDNSSTVLRWASSSETATTRDCLFNKSIRCSISSSTLTVKGFRILS